MRHLAAEWQRVHLALREGGLSPVVLGSFACLGFLSEGARSVLWTDDLDFGLPDAERATRETACAVMRHLGYSPSGPGKWRGPTAESLEVDLIAPGGAPEAGLSVLRSEWWFTWMLHDLRDYRLPPSWTTPHIGSEVMLAPSPGAALFGKALKTAGYLARHDWPNNHRDVAHATKAAHDALLIMVDVDLPRLALPFEVNSLGWARMGPPEARTSLQQASRCFVDLFGDRSAIGYTLASPAATANGTDLGHGAEAGAALARTIADAPSLMD